MIKPTPLLLVSYRFVWRKEAECVYFFSVTCQISKLHEQLFEKKNDLQSNLCLAAPYY